MTVRITQQRRGTKANPWHLLWSDAKGNPAKRLRNRVTSSMNCRQPKVTLPSIRAFNADEVVIEQKFPYREGSRTE